MNAAGRLLLAAWAFWGATSALAQDFNVIPVLPESGKPFMLVSWILEKCTAVAAPVASVAARTIVVPVSILATPCSANATVQTFNSQVQVPSPGEYIVQMKVGGAAPRELGKLWVAAAGTVEDSLSFRALPATPAAGELFVLQANGTAGLRSIEVDKATVEITNGVILIVADLVDTGYDRTVPATFRAAATATVPASGHYRVDLQARSRGTTTQAFPRVVVGEIDVGPATAAAPATFRGLGGIWWDPAEPGSSLHVVENESGQLFLVWYTYTIWGLVYPGTAHGSTWHVVSAGRWMSPVQYRGVLYDPAGRASNLPLDPSAHALSPIGVASVFPLGPDRLDLEVRADTGISPIINLRKTLQRYRF